MADSDVTGGVIPADQQPRTKLEATDPNQTNPGSAGGEQAPAIEENGAGPGNAATEQESGAGYGNHATGYEDE